MADRRQALSAAGTLPVLRLSTSAAAAQPGFSRMPGESQHTPKLCLGYVPADEAGFRRLKQIGVDHVLTGGPHPVDRSRRAHPHRSLSRRADHALQHDDRRLRRRDLGTPGADAQIADVITSIRAAGKAGLTVIEYNFYANRLMEGYKEEIGRGGAATRPMTTRCRRRCRRRKASARTPARSSSSEREHFLKASFRKPRRPMSVSPSIPTIRRCRSAAARNRSWPPSTTGRSTWVWSTVPINGMTFDCGVTREMGEDPVAVCRYLGERDRINHVHFRNVVVRTPYVDYTEVSWTMAR